MTSARRDKEQYELFDDLFDGDAGNDSFYDEQEIASLLEDDEISGDEEAFMQGYMGEEEE